ncbi:DUF2778 domain-containing protein [Methylocystis echinoides]|uniref:Tlde1 domain-containing protein n=1 Tax=Methylocystis echinoides TaxID=29468 RepID=A0A9W6LTJ8_9HYPH|nr:tlde1 domain-containing protein [Methylocystis echinoides]GLI94464.1 hypothetical protein LMG27198_34560 [Methylocystis echinoides]
MTAGHLVQPFLADAAGTDSQSPARVARVASPEPAAVGLRGALLADLGPYEPQGFAPRRAMRANLFVSRAEAGTRIAEAPVPPPRPAEIPLEKTVAQAEPQPATPVIESAGAPTPPRRPAELSVALRPEPPKPQGPEIARAEPAAAPPAPRPIRAARTTVVPGAPAEHRGFFERLFGGVTQPAAPQTGASREALAYAPASDAGSLFGGLRSAVAPVNPAARYDRYTAIYDISAHVVYMPDGSRLEAHSGLREHLDDARYVHLRMRGPTPPHIYNLTPREALFHGVEALRLNPVGGGGAIFGRAGLLAHTYMLGPNGDSNGCVSFRDYSAFLQAYKRGEVRRLAVVSRL